MLPAATVDLHQDAAPDGRANGDDCCGETDPVHRAELGKSKTTDAGEHRDVCPPTPPEPYESQEAGVIRERRRHSMAPRHRGRGHARASLDALDGVIRGDAELGTKPPLEPLLLLWGQT